jgi:hypothetical protein
MGAFLYNDFEMGNALASYRGIAPPNIGFKTLSDVNRWSSWWHPRSERPECNIENVIENENKGRR